MRSVLSASVTLLLLHNRQFRLAKTQSSYLSIIGESRLPQAPLLVVILACLWPLLLGVLETRIVFAESANGVYSQLPPSPSSSNVFSFWYSGRLLNIGLIRRCCLR